ncbi:TIGR00266 family protein [uncultured Acetobacteroides sp.]|uniref:TIGR00266 family protein n=1 Tax=uncultured Acetobacteroides sp. TaxID=1760811 RepID=UPI0029F55D0D|nr:TIGR00266 family protein [uncultured Acetobacteroides sp.]
MIPLPIRYQITGETYQTLEVTLNPGETIVAEAGTMVFMDDGITYETCLGDGSEPNMGIMGKMFPTELKPLPCETLFLTYFTNYGRGSRKITFSTPYVGSIHLIDLSAFNHEIVVQRNAFICGPKGLKLQPYTPTRMGITPKNETVPLEKISGEGEVYIAVCGLLIERELNNEAIHAEISSIVGFQSGISYSVEASGRLKTMVLGNTGSTLATLSGTGKVWMQSLPLKKMVQTITTCLQQLHMTEGKLLGKLYEE